MEYFTMAITLKSNFCITALFVTTFSSAQVPNVFEPNTPANAEDVNENFDYLYEQLQASTNDTGGEGGGSNNSTCDNLHRPLDYDFKERPSNNMITVNGENYVIRKLPFREFQTNDIYFISYPARGNRSNEREIFYAPATISHSAIDGPGCEVQINTPNEVQTRYSVYHNRTFDTQVTFDYQNTVFSEQQKNSAYGFLIIGLNFQINETTGSITVSLPYYNFKFTDEPPVFPDTAIDNNEFDNLAAFVNRLPKENDEVYERAYEALDELFDYIRIEKYCTYDANTGECNTI